MENGNGNGMVMPVAPYYGGGSGGGNGFFGQDGWWIILLLLVCGGWGNGIGGFGGGNAIPWMNTNNDVQRGFDQNAVITGINGVQNAVTSGIGDIQTALCNGFAGVNASISNGFAQSEIADNARQMANMQQIFGIQSSLQNCCCENRLATANQTATILAEHCADRQVFSDGVSDILTNQNNGVQRILDQMCADKIDAKNEKIADLERQLTLANLAASQGAQTAALIANNEAQTTALEQYLAPVPRPAYIVQNPNCCGQNYGCGCGA